MLLVSVNGFKFPFNFFSEFLSSIRVPVTLFLYCAFFPLLSTSERADYHLQLYRSVVKGVVEDFLKFFKILLSIKKKKKMSVREHAQAHYS